jgi:hypothetical protein
MITKMKTVKPVGFDAGLRKSTLGVSTTPRVAS